MILWFYSMTTFTWILSIPIHKLWNSHVWNLSKDLITFLVRNALNYRIRVCSMFADALVSDAARAPVDVMLPLCILQILSFHWCRFLWYSCTICMSRNVRKFSFPCVTSVTWTNLSLYLIITWRINRQHDDLTVPMNARRSIYMGLITKLSF